MTLVDGEGDPPLGMDAGKVDVGAAADETEAEDALGAVAIGGIGVLTSSATPTAEEEEPLIALSPDAEEAGATAAAGRAGVAGQFAGAASPSIVLQPGSFSNKPTVCSLRVGAMWQVSALAFTPARTGQAGGLSAIPVSLLLHVSMAFCSRSPCHPFMKSP